MSTDPGDGTAIDDRDLMALHLAGDPHAFSEVVRRHQNRLWSVALRMMRDPEAASDAVQDALLSAYRRADSYRGDAAVSTWLYRVVVNACLDRIRRERARPTAPLPEVEPSTGVDDQQRAVDRLTVEWALAQLPEPQRAAIVLVDLQELPVTEAAGILGVPPGTVKSRCSRGRAALAELLLDRSGGGRNRPEPAPVQARTERPDQTRPGRPDHQGDPTVRGSARPDHRPDNRSDRPRATDRPQLGGEP